MTWNAQMPLHTIIQIQMGVTGVQEKRYKLMETQSKSYWVIL
jgi:6-phosphofructo-2-kinase/fructose-2,6-biphosphatase